MWRFYASLQANLWVKRQYESPLDMLIGETDSAEVEALLSDTNKTIVETILPDTNSQKFSNRRLTKSARQDTLLSRLL
jgi:hypothetical protein